MRASLKYFWVFGGGSGAVNGTLTVPSASAQPTVTAPSSLSGISNGTVTVSGVSDTPSVTASSSLTGVRNGTLTQPQPSTLPVVAAPIISSGQLGIVTQPYLSLQPSISAATLTGIQQGSLVQPASSLQAVVLAATLTAGSLGVFDQPAVSAQTVVSAAAMAGQQQGSVASPAVSLQPAVAVAQLVGSSLLDGTLAAPQSTLQAIVQAVSLPAATAGAVLLRFTGLHSTSQLTLRRLDNNAVVYSGTPINGQIECTADTDLLVSLVTGSGLSTDERDKLLSAPTADSNATAVWANAERTLTAASSSSLTTEEHNKLMSVPTASENALAQATRIVENNLTNDDLIKLKASVLLGKVVGAGTGTEKFRDLADSKDRITATIDSSGNRTVVVLDAD